MIAEQALIARAAGRPRFCGNYVTSAGFEVAVTLRGSIFVKSVERGEADEARPPKGAEMNVGMCETTRERARPMHMLAVALVAVLFALQGAWAIATLHHGRGASPGEARLAAPLREKYCAVAPQNERAPMDDENGQRFCCMFCGADEPSIGYETVATRSSISTAPTCDARIPLYVVDIDDRALAGWASVRSSRGPPAGS